MYLNIYYLIYFKYVNYPNKNPIPNKIRIYKMSYGNFYRPLYLIENWKFKLLELYKYISYFFTFFWQYRRILNLIIELIAVIVYGIIDSIENFYFMWKFNIECGVVNWKRIRSSNTPWHTDIISSLDKAHYDSIYYFYPGVHRSYLSLSWLITRDFYHMIQLLLLYLVPW